MDGWNGIGMDGGWLDGWLEWNGWKGGMEDGWLDGWLECNSWNGRTDGLAETQTQEATEAWMDGWIEVNSGACVEASPSKRPAVLGPLRRDRPECPAFGEGFVGVGGWTCNGWQ